MTKTIAAFAVSCAFAFAAAAHPDHDEPDFYVAPTFDCSAMAGTYDAGAKRVVKVAFADGKVTLTQTGSPDVTGECMAPMIASGAYLPRARAALGVSFGLPAGAADCCTFHLKGEKLVFDGTPVTWSRRKDAKAK